MWNDPLGENAITFIVYIVDFDFRRLATPPGTQGRARVMTDASDGLTGLAAMPNLVQHSLSSAKEREFQFQFPLDNKET